MYKIYSNTKSLTTLNDKKVHIYDYDFCKVCLEENINHNMMSLLYLQDQDLFLLFTLRLLLRYLGHMSGQ